MYQLHFPGALVAGEGALEALRGLVLPKERVCVLTDPGVTQSGLTQRVQQVLQQAGVRAQVMDQVPAEPSYEDVQQVANALAQGDFQTLIALGGGSVMDTAKLCSIAPAGVTVKRLLEAPQEGRKTLRTIMLPTTAGTGAEATPNAVVAVPEKQVKVGIVSAAMMPDAVILAPEMIRTLPRRLAASTGMDALCHAVECYTSRAATPLSDLYALEAIRLIFANLLPSMASMEAMASKEAMMLGAFYGGVAIAASGTTAVHALSYPLGGRYHIPHGMANAVLLLPVMRFNLPCCVDRLARMYDVLEMRGAVGEAEKAQLVLERMESLMAMTGLPTDLRPWGVGEEALEELVSAGMSVERLLKNNLRKVTEDDARMIYRQVLGGGKA